MVVEDRRVERDEGGSAQRTSTIWGAAIMTMMRPKKIWMLPMSWPSVNDSTMVTYHRRGVKSGRSTETRTGQAPHHDHQPGDDAEEHIGRA